MVLNGLDHLADAAPWLKGRRLGLITSTSGVTRMLTSGIDAIHAQFPLTALFGPEHGVRGDHDAGATVKTYTDPATRLPVYSLYRKDSQHMTPEITRPVFCNESGSTLRFILPLFSLTAQKVRFTGAGRLMQRPQEIYAQLFERQGLRFEQNEQGITIFGRLCPGTFTLPGNVSSQFISGLLFATPLMEAPSTIEVRAPFESRSYVDLTTDAMQKFGVKVSVRARKDGSATYKVAAPQHYAAADMDVEGDYSQAAFLAVLGSTVGGITITGLPSGSHQGDRVILDILKQCGAKFERSGSHVTFHRSLLKAVEIDLADCPDLGPVLIALGCFCSGTTIIRNAGRLRIKECDRIAAMQEELAKMGSTVKADGDTLTIEGCALHKPTAPLNGHNDHRIVMAMAVAALAAGQPAVIEGANAVNKSWPDFFEVIKGLGAHVTNQG